MTEELVWGLPVIGYLFLAGTGAGAVTVSASVLLRGGGFGQSRHVLARYGALAGPLPVIAGTLLIVFELGAPFRVLNLFKLINLSPMSIGTWFLAVFIVLSLAYAACFVLPSAWRWTEGARLVLAWLCLPSGIGVAVYTGILLGAMPARPFWNSPIVAFLFLLSALSCGTACIVLLMGLFRPKSPDLAAAADLKNSMYLLANADAVLISGELAIIFLFVMFSHLTIGSPKEAVKVILAGGELAWLFWGLVVLVGTLIPFLVEIAMVIPKLLLGRPFRSWRAVEVALPVAVLVGGWWLRYVVVVAGQVTGPVGL